MRKDIFTSKKLFLASTFFVSMLSPIAIVSCGSRNEGNSSDIYPEINTIVNSEIISNQYYISPFFNLDVFKYKRLNEINYDLIKSSILDSVLQNKNIKITFPNDNNSIYKNEELNFFTFRYNFTYKDLNNPDTDKWEQWSSMSYSYQTIYLPLQADDKIDLDLLNLKELVKHQTNDSIINSFKNLMSTQHGQQPINNKMFQQQFYLDGVSYWSKLLGTPGQVPYVYYTYIDNSFQSNIEDNILIKYQFGAGFPPSIDSEYNLPFYEITYKATEDNKYEKIDINSNSYLRITLAPNSIELLDKRNDQTYTNDFETIFYIDITNWKR